MSIVPMSLSIPTLAQSLSSAKTLLGGSTLTTKLSQLSMTTPSSIPFKSMPIRICCGPRTYPGGVSRRKWKMMQTRKAKQLLKAGLARERKLYSRRKRAELKAAVSELERPWENVEKPPNLFSVSVDDEQLKVLADRFQKPGPELVRPDNGLPSARFSPERIVRSFKPYGKIDKITTASDELDSSNLEEDSDPGLNSGSAGKMDLQRKGPHKNSRSSRIDSDIRGNVSSFRPRSSEGVANDHESENNKGKFRKTQRRRNHLSDSDGMNYVSSRFHGRNYRRNNRLGTNAAELRRSKSSEMG